MAYQAYSETQESHLDWAPSFPAHWSRRQIRFLLRDGYDGLKIGPFGSQIKLQHLTDSGFKIYGQENVIGHDFELGQRYLSPESFEELRVYEIHEGDVLVTMMGTSGRCKIAPIGLQPGIMDSHLIRLRTNKEITSQYLCYLIDQSSYIRIQIELFGKGSIMHGLNSSVIKSLDVLLPPLEEQAQIVSFLDWKTGQIDALITKKKQLIEKLNEKRIALITQAVTKGLNPAAPMRDSGSPLLGEVPEHWDTKRMRFLISSIQQGWSPRASNNPADEGEMGVLKLSAIKKGYFDPSENKHLEEIPEGQTILSPEHGDVFISRANTPALVGDACYIPKNCPWLVIPDLIYRLKIEERVLHPEFVAYFLLSLMGRAQIEAQARGSSGSMVKLSQGHLKDFVLPQPPLLESQNIAQECTRLISKIEALLLTTRETIERLTEYRTALITATTTGKIDVRNIKLGATV